MPTTMEIVRIPMFDPVTGSRCKASQPALWGLEEVKEKTMLKQWFKYHAEFGTQRIRLERCPHGMVH
jgi:hypothetical protein